MNRRIALIRKESGLNQQAFAEKLGLSKNFISLVETGGRVPSDRTISDICREFAVNEHWLRTGEGDMFRPVSRDAEITAFVSQTLSSAPDDFRRRLVSVLARLSVDEWQVLERMAQKLLEEYSKEDQPEG